VPVEYDEDLLRRLREELSGLPRPVTLRYADGGRPEVGEILSLIEGASGGVVRAERLPPGSLPLEPAVVVAERARIFGVPAGYEFTSLVGAVVDASRGPPPNRRVEQALARLGRSVRILVFTTRSCPVCPLAVRAALRLAMRSPLVSSDAVDAADFPSLAEEHGVYAVPKVVVYVDGERRGEEVGVPPLPLEGVELALVRLVEESLL